MDRRLRFALIVVVALTLVYAAAAALALSGVVKSADVAVHRVETPSAEAPSLTPSYLLDGIWLRFDTPWYMDIATAGYRDPHSVVFYPLYPLLIRALSWLGLPPLAAALVIARLALVLLLYGLLLLLDLKLMPREALVAAALLLAWPGGFLFCAAYPDSLLLALTVWASWFARNQRWWPAALCAVLASVTKASGAAAVIGLVVTCARNRQRLPASLAAAVAGVFLYPAALWFAGMPQPLQMYRLYWWPSPDQSWDTVSWIGFLLPVMLLTFGGCSHLAKALRSPYIIVPVASVFVLMHCVFLFAFWTWSAV